MLSHCCQYLSKYLVTQSLHFFSVWCFTFHSSGVRIKLCHGPSDSTHDCQLFITVFESYLVPLPAPEPCPHIKDAPLTLKESHSQGLALRTYFVILKALQWGFLASGATLTLNIFIRSVKKIDHRIEKQWNN